MTADNFKAAFKGQWEETEQTLLEKGADQEETVYFRAAFYAGAAAALGLIVEPVNGVNAELDRFLEETYREPADTGR